MGVNVYKRGSIDANASLTTMGGTSNQTLILVDGFDIRPENTMYSNLDFPFSIYDIEKIEVFQGSASRKYSSKAISAVINIITKVADSQESNFNAKGGSGPINVNVVSHIKTDHSNHVLSLTNLTATGLQDNDSTLAMSAYYKYFVENGRNKTHLSFGYLDKANGNSTIYRATTNQSKFLNGKIQWEFDDKTLESNFHWNNSIYEIVPNETQDALCYGGSSDGSEDETACNALGDATWTTAIERDSSEVTNLGYGFKGVLYNKHGGLSTYRIDISITKLMKQSPSIQTSRGLSFPFSVSFQ